MLYNIRHKESSVMVMVSPSPFWILKGGGLESSGQRLISLYGKTIKKKHACVKLYFLIFRCLQKKSFFFSDVCKNIYIYIFFFKTKFRFLDYFSKFCDGVLSSLLFFLIFSDLFLLFRTHCPVMIFIQKVN